MYTGLSSALALFRLTGPAMSLPRAMAVVQRGDALISESVELPALQEHQVYVKVEYAAFNPTDRMFLLNWSHVTHMITLPRSGI